MEITKIFLLLPPRLGIFLTPLREETLQNVKIFVFRKKRTRIQFEFKSNIYYQSLFGWIKMQE